MSKDEREEAVKEAERVANTSIDEYSSEPEYRVSRVVEALLRGRRRRIRVLRRKGLRVRKQGLALLLRGSHWRQFGVALAGAILSSNNLKFLELEGNFGDSEGMPVDCAHTLANALRWSNSIITLRFISNDIVPSSAVVLVQGLRDAAHLNCVLVEMPRCFSQGDKDVESALTQMIGKGNSALNHLELKSDGGADSPDIGPSGAQAIASGLALNFSLRTLDLSSQGIGDEGVTALAEAIQSSTVGLEVLILPNNGITPTGATSLATALGKNKTLEQLVLATNRLEYTGAAAIAEALRENRSLRSLQLSGTSIDSAGTEAIAQALKVNTGLIALLMGSNEIGDYGAKAIGNALQANTTLIQVQLTLCKFGASGVMELARGVRQHPSLRQLDIEGNYFGLQASRFMRQQVRARGAAGLPACAVSYRVDDAAAYLSYVLGFLVCCCCLCGCNMCWQEQLTLVSRKKGCSIFSSRSPDRGPGACVAGCLEPMNTCAQAFTCLCCQPRGAASPALRGDELETPYDEVYRQVFVDPEDDAFGHEGNEGGDGDGGD